MSRSPKRLPDGMVRRPGRTGYYADFTVAGQRVRRFLADTLDVACELLAELKARAYRRKFNVHDNSARVADVRRQYEEHCRQHLRPRTLEHYRGRLDRILAALGAVYVSQITAPAVLAYRRDRLAGESAPSPRTVNTEVGALQAMLNWAAGEDVRLIAANPIAGVRPLPHPRPKQGRPLTAEELQAVFQASPEHWRRIWYTYGVTGMRASELIALEFTPEFLDWPVREITIPGWLAKSGKARRVPMDDRLYQILRDLEAGREARQPGKGRGPITAARVQKRFTRDRIFTTTQNTPLNRNGLYRAFLRCCKAASVEVRTMDGQGREVAHVDLHSLRRTFTTLAIGAGADPAAVQQILGHATLGMTMNVYHKANPQQRRAAIEKLPYSTLTPKPGHQSDATPGSPA